MLHARSLLFLLVSLACYFNTSSADGDFQEVSKAVRNGWGSVRENVVDPGLSRSKALAEGIANYRSSRTTDVKIVNYSSYKFYLQANGCSTGQFSTAITPPEVLEPQSENFYGTESSQTMRGVKCNVKYTAEGNKGEGGAEFSIQVSNPYIGWNSVNTDSSSDLSIEEELGRGHNNQVVVTVSNAERELNDN